MRSPLRLARVALVALVGASALAVPATAASAGSGSDGDAGAQTLDLPPYSRDALAAIFDPALAKLGLRTTRASLQDLEVYRSSPTGTHLAMYVEPIDPQGVDDDYYLERVASTTKVFLPKVFARWSDLESFDVCMEPVEIPSPSPPPVTQLQVDRKTAKKIRWQRSDLADLVGEAAKRSEGDDESGNRESFFLYLSPRLRGSKLYLDARDDAGLPPLTTTTRARTF